MMPSTSIAYPSRSTLAFQDRFKSLPADRSKVLKDCSILKEFLSKALAFLTRDHCANERFSEQVAHYLMGKIDRFQLPLDLQEHARSLDLADQQQAVKSELFGLLRTNRFGYRCSSEAPGKTIAKLNALYENLPASVPVGREVEVNRPFQTEERKELEIPHCEEEVLDLREECVGRVRVGGQQLKTVQVKKGVTVSSFDPDDLSQRSRKVVVEFHGDQGRSIDRGTLPGHPYHSGDLLLLGINLIDAAPF